MSIVVVGGGISGLSIAWYLRRALPETPLVVLESNTRPGGKVWTDRSKGYLIESGPNGFLDNKTSTIELCQSLDIAHQLVAADEHAAHRFIFLGDRLRELPTSPGRFLTSDLLSLRGKLRAIWEHFTPPKLTQGDESIQQFGARRFGHEATDVLLDAMVTGIYAGDPGLLSLPACFPKLAEMERQFGGIIRGQMAMAKQKPSETTPGSPAVKRTLGGTLLAPRAGMGAIIEALEEKLKGNLLLSKPARAIERVGEGKWRVRGDGAEEWPAEAVILACPADFQASLLQSVDANLAKDVGKVSYAAAVVAGVGYPIDAIPEFPLGFGYIAPERLNRPVLGVIWSSSVFSEQAPPGFYQFRAILGGWRRADVANWDDDAILRAVREDLRIALGITASPDHSTIVRWPKGIPQYQIGHLERIRRIGERAANYPGLFLGGNSYRGVSINDCTQDAEAIGKAVVKYLNPPQSTA